MIVLPPVQKKPSFGERFNKSMAAAAEAAQDYQLKKSIKEQQEQEIRREDETIKRLIGKDISGIKDPKMREKLLELSIEAEKKQRETAEKLKSNKQIIEDLERNRGLESGALSAYMADPKMAELVSRPPKQSKKTQASQPIDPEQLKIIKQVRATPEYKEADPLQKYQMLTDAGASKENAQVESEISAKQAELESKKFETSYKAQEDFIDETTRSYRGFETEMKPRLKQMQKMVTDQDLISPTSAVFLDAMGIPLGALEDPSSELYNKVSQDLLKGLPETYGNRILKVEVENFLKTIPTLLNSANGRRMIASNMLKLGEMKEVYYNEMRRQQKGFIDTDKSFPKDFQQRVLDNVKPQIDRINDEFVKMSEITDLPEGTIPFFDPSGNIKFVPKNLEQWAIDNGGKRIW